MKKITILFAAFVLLSLGFTVIEKKVSKPEPKQLEQEFKVSDSLISPYHQSRNDVATYD
jgi:hypothetical protein